MITQSQIIITKTANIVKLIFSIRRKKLPKQLDLES